MKLIWFKNCLNDPEAKENLELILRNSTTSFGRLKEILDDQLRELDGQEMTPNYTDASWSHKQAHRNGVRQKLTEVIDLITLDKIDPQ